MRIAFQGAPGAYSEAAAQRAWPGVETVPMDQFEDVFAAVASGLTSHGLLPVENSTGGSIHRNYDLLLEHDLPIVAETELQVVHHLVALPGTELAQIRRVCSHPQALAQCESFLRSLPNVEIVATYDTAGSARLIRDQSLRDTAAVASARAAEIFGLTVVQSAIQDYRDNITRFLLIARDPQPLGAAGQDLTGLRVAECAGCPVQGVERVRAARHRPHQARVAADARSAVGVSLLRGSRGWAIGRALRTRDRAPGGVGAMGQDARLVRALERSGDPGDGNRGPNRRVRRVSAGRQLEEGLEFQAVSRISA